MWHARTDTDTDRQTDKHTHTHKSQWLLVFVDEVTLRKPPEASIQLLLRKSSHSLALKFWKKKEKLNVLFVERLTLAAQVQRILTNVCPCLSTSQTDRTDLLKTHRFDTHFVHNRVVCTCSSIDCVCVHLTLGPSIVQAIILIHTVTRLLTGMPESVYVSEDDLYFKQCINLKSTTCT